MGKVKIGLEIHMHLNTKKKLFCNCDIPLKTDEVNSHICPRCTGQPGSKPMRVNKEALAQTIKLGLIANSHITKLSNFQRKHYSWPDMPTGFQRTMSGNVDETCIGGEFNGINISEIHLEEDPAAWDPQTGEINYNRSGFPLAEFVTEPDFDSTDKLKEWLEELVLTAKYLGVLNEEYGIKSDVNVSIEETGYKRVEIKNVGSLSGIVAAAEVEIRRQRELFEQGKEVLQETRRYNEATDETEFMRSKENAQDYMFTPEPDLPNVEVSEELIEELRSTLPELPSQKREKYAKYKFDEETINVLVSNLYLTHLFEHAIDAGLNAKEVGLFMRREILRILNYHKADFKDLEAKDIKHEISDLLDLLGTDKISYTTAQKLIEDLWERKFDVKSFVKENNLEQVQDDSLIEELVVKALKEAPQAVEDYKNGNTKSLNFVVGIVMRETKGTAKPQVVNKVMLEKVKEL